MVIDLTLADVPLSCFNCDPARISGWMVIDLTLADVPSGQAPTDGILMKQLFLIAAIGGSVALVSAFFAPDQWRLPLLVLAGIAGLAMTVARAALNRALTSAQRLVEFLYEVIFWIALIGLIFFLTR